MFGNFFTDTGMIIKANTVHHGKGWRFSRVMKQAAKGEGRNLDGQPALRGKLRAVVSTFLNISIDSTYRSLLISEKPLRLLIHFWSNPSLKAHIGDIFSNLFKPPDATIDLLIELGWRRAYASSGILIDILDI